MALPAAFRAAIDAALPAEAIVSEPEQLRTYECDALTGHRAMPELVVLPSTAAQVAEIVRSCHLHGVPFVARGAGTGLSGGALPVADGIVISLARLDRVLEIDLDRARVVVEPGVTNLDITRAVSAAGFYYAPDPSSQQVCTIGGNVAENSGGAHCLKHGFTVNHVLAADVVLPDGELVTLSRDDDGPDLLGAFVGSEGTLGIAVRIVVRVLRAPETVRTLLAAFESTDAAGEAVSARSRRGILPAAIEMMDALTLEAVEAAVSPGYPAGAGAVLIVELDGPEAQVHEDSAAVEAICRASGAFEVRAARSAEERALVWRGRKAVVRLDGPDLAELLRPGRRRAADAAARGAAPHLRARRRGTACGSRASSTPATGTCTRSCSTTTASRARPPSPSASRRRSSTPASTRAGRSPASTASASTRPARCRSSSARATSRRCCGCAPRSIRTGSRTPARRSRPRGSAARCRGRTACTHWSGPGLPSVSEPASLEEAAEVLRAGPSVSIDRDGGDVVLSTRRLDRVLEHEPGDLTAIVEAGLRLSELQAALAPHGQMLALDPPGDPTIGACLAGDLSGPRRHRYGAMRDLVLGVTVVLADGTIASSGGKVVKNVAGYDLGKLFAGSRGRLGLVARLALRLHPQPAAEATVVAESDDPRALWLELQRSQLAPSAVDFLPPGRLALLFEGGAAAVEAQVAASPGAPADAAVWAEAGERQLAATSRASFDWQACRLARPGPGIAWVDGPPGAWSPLAERVRAAFDPEGVLA